MFEKSLYDLIRGLRNHRGNEREYIQNSLKECRAEIKSQDMDLKATALLKLVYLEMFGHDMSWASFHVLEVMSSAKYMQKRVGYLGAVQSFRPDTEVLMLATNLLKKDLTSPLAPTMSLPLTTVPHIITPSLSMSLLADLIPRMGHANPSIRKKTIVTLYRLALVYPETLRVAWPKIKERLMDENEDPSVTAAIVNVVCELGWRRPQDFLPLAPRLFELLVDGDNNWRAIKIIKLFATLTPLEPRLVRKLLPPLTTIIRTTPAMSLLYECVNGIIQGGILSGAEGTAEGDDIASLCIDKLRGMIVVEGDPNLKYVALLAFNKIVTSHPHLVSLHQDVILACIDNADISIRLRALDLVVGMVNSDNLSSVVERLMRQLRNSPVDTGAGGSLNDRTPEMGIEPAADSDGEDPEETLNTGERKSNELPALPDDYRTGMIARILEMCSRQTYANITDFEWYIDIITQLISLTPSTGPSAGQTMPRDDQDTDYGSEGASIADALGSELVNVAVRVKSVRAEATCAAESLLLQGLSARRSSAIQNDSGDLQASIVWIVGEYAQFLEYPEGTLDCLVQSSNTTLAAGALSTCVQAILKIFARVVCSTDLAWTAERKSATLLLIAKIIHFLEVLIVHPDLEVQERSVEFYELMRLAEEAVSGQNVSEPGSSGDVEEAPLLLTHALPSLFLGWELNPVARDAQKKVPPPEGLNLDLPINSELQTLLDVSVPDDAADGDYNEFLRFYNDRPMQSREAEPAANRLTESSQPSPSYQQVSGSSLIDPDKAAAMRAERRERTRDDPFYIAGADVSSGNSTPGNNVFQRTNGENLDIDAIPIMELDLESSDQSKILRQEKLERLHGRKSKNRRKIDITGDENVLTSDGGDSEANEKAISGLKTSRSKGKKSLLQVDSSGLRGISLETTEQENLSRANEEERRLQEEQEMARALQEVERLRLEMQRAAERIEAAKGVPPEGMLIKKKKKKKKAVVAVDDEAGNAQLDPAMIQGHGDGSEVLPPEAKENVGEKMIKKKKRKKKVDKVVEPGINQDLGQTEGEAAFGP